MPSASGSSTRAPELAAVLLVLLALVLVLGPVAMPGEALFFRDHSTVFRRLFAQVAEAYRSGHLPLWDPLIGGGEPLAAYPASVAFSPLHLITIVIPAALDPYDLFVVACYLVGGAGAYALAAVLGVDRRGRLTASALFALGGPLISLNNLVPALHSAVFGPWSLAAALVVWRAPSRRGVAALATALALHAEGADPALLVCDVIVFFGALAIMPAPEGPSLIRRASMLAAGAVLGVGLAMIQILPLLDLLRGTPRATGYAGSAWSAHPLQLAELSLPGLAGDFLERRTLFNAREGGRHYLASIYLSALALPSLVLALSFRRARALALTTIVCLLLALGDRTPLLALVKAVFPGAASSRFPIKYVYGAALTIPILIPIAIDRIITLSPKLVVGVLGAWLLLAAAVVVIPADWVLAHASAYQLDAEGVIGLLAGASSQTVLVTGVVLGLVILARRNVAWAWGLPAVLALDVALAARPILPTMEALPRDPPALGRLLLADDRHPTIFRYEAPPSGPLDMGSDTRRGFDTLEPMGASPAGIRYMLDTDLNDIRPHGWAAVARAVRAIPDEGTRLRVLARLGHTHLLVSTRQRELPGLDYVGTATVANSPRVSVFRIEGARPRVSFVSRARHVPDFSAALAALTSSTAGVDEVMVVDEVLTGTIAVYAGTVTLAANGGVTVDARAPGLVVITQRYDRGWRAQLDGEDTPIIPVDAILTGIPVAAGHHQLTLTYAPRSVDVGAFVSLVSLLVVLTLALRGASGRARARDPR